ncbi:MAG: hypothetical protein ABH848_04480 [Candidatus Omnitrophota bacterium]
MGLYKTNKNNEKPGIISMPGFSALNRKDLWILPPLLDNPFPMTKDNMEAYPDHYQKRRLHGKLWAWK